MRVVRIEKDEWASMSEDVHTVVFEEQKPRALDRLDFALLIENEEEERPLAYATVRELDAESLYWQYGGSFPLTKGTVTSLRCMQLLLEWARGQGYKRVSFLVENTNFPMLKLAMKVGAYIWGVRVFKGSTLLEHRIEFEGYKNHACT